MVIALSVHATHDEAQAHAVTMCEEAYGGQLVSAIVALIKQGLTSLPEILAELQKLGISLPPWVSLVINILLTVLKPA